MRALGGQRRHGADRAARPSRSGRPAASSKGSTGWAARSPGVDALALLGERAALMGLWRRGATSCGGSCRLLRAADGWMAVSLPRDDDMDLVAAWLELDDGAGLGSRPCGPRSPRVWPSDDPDALVGAGAAARAAGRPRRGGGRHRADVPACSRRASARHRSRPDLERPARGRPVRPVGRPSLRRPAGPCRRLGGEGRVDAAPRRCAPRQPRLLRSPERAQALGRARPAGPRGDPGPARARRTGGRGDRGQPAARAGAVRDLEDPTWSAPAVPQVWVSITGYGRSDEDGQPGGVRRRRRGCRRPRRLERCRPAVLRAMPSPTR